MRSKITAALMLFGVLVLGMVALAQTSAPPTPELFGMSATLVTLLLGLASSVLSAVFDRTNFSRAFRYLIVYSVSAAIGIVGAILSKQFIGDALTQNLGLTILAVFGATEGVYKLLQFNLIKYLQENVGNTAKNPAAPPA